MRSIASQDVAKRSDPMKKVKYTPWNQRKSGSIRTKPNYRNTELWRISSFLNCVVMMIIKIKSKNTDFCVNP